MRKKIKFQAVLSFILIIGIVLGLTGCAGGNNGTGNQAGKEAGGNDSGEQDEAQTMGRYMETEIDLRGHLSRPDNIVRKEDGSLLVLDYNNGIIQSKDNGETWEKLQLTWLDEEIAANYIMDLAASPIKGYAVVSSVNSEEEEEVDYSLDPQYYYVDEEGNKTSFDIPYDKDNYDYINKLYFSPDGKLFGSALGGKVYELNTQDGTYKVISKVSSTVDNIYFAGNLMLMVNVNSIDIYNYVTGEPAEKDSALVDFIKNELGDQWYSNTDSYGLIMTAGEEENVIYFAINKGLYRHVIGGGAIEQVIDGTLCSLGEPSMYLVDMLRMENGSFFILYTGSLIRYDYDETVPSVPNKKITAYSLKENDVLRQAISNYQKKNPDVYVVYEIGMEGSSGITRDDALKKLNTEIMAGKGPDLLLMDGLPMDSYIEKGLLSDISPYIADLVQDGLLLENILDIYRKDGKIYTLPAEIKILLLLGDQEAINGINDLQTFADAVEALRKKYPDGPLLRCYTEEMVLRILSMSSMPAMITEDGNLDEARLKEFLTAAKRIYQAEYAGVDPEEKILYQKNMEDGFEEMEVYLMSVTINSFSILTGDCRISAGTLGSFDWDLSELVSLKDEMENIDYKPYNGMAQNVFKPSTLAAINVKSEYQEEAGALLHMLYSEETLNMPVRTGFAVNKNSIKNEMEKVNGYGGEVYGGMASTDEDGNYVEFDMRGSTQEELDGIMSVLEQAAIPNAGYDIIESAIYELGPNALNGSATVEETASQIMKKVAIYLAE